MTAWHAPTVVGTYHAEDVASLECVGSGYCADCARRLGIEYLDGHTLASATWATWGVVDWPPGGVAAHRHRINQWITRQGAEVHRMSHGGLGFHLPQNRDGPMEIIDPPDWDRGYRVVGEDGRWPSWWPTHGAAMAIASLRQRLRALPRDGADWVAQRDTTGYSQIKADRRYFARFGYNVPSQPYGPISGHRASFIAFYGYSPETVDHLCKMPRCVHPGHLGDATWEENQAREFLGTDYGLWRRPKPPARRKGRPTYSTSTPETGGLSAADGNLQDALSALAARYGRDHGQR